MSQLIKKKKLIYNSCEEWHMLGKASAYHHKKLGLGLGLGLGLRLLFSV